MPVRENTRSGFERARRMAEMLIARTGRMPVRENTRSGFERTRRMARDAYRVYGANARARRMAEMLIAWLY